MARTSNFANVATVTRASTKTDAGGWDFTNGGTVGTLTEYASGVAAIHPTAGLLVEESTTNQIRNPRFENATAGAIGGAGVWPYVSTPGDAGTPFATAGTLTVNSVGVEDGWDYLEVNMSHSASSTYILPLEGVTIPPFVQNDPSCLSLGVKIVSGTVTGTVRLVTEEHQSGGGYLTEGSVVYTPTTTHARYYLARTVANASTASLYAFTSFVLTGSHNVTLRIYAPQLEEKAYPTSPVFPVAASPAATTRAADDIAISNGAWSNDNGAGSFYVNCVFNYDGQASTFPRVMSYNSGASDHASIYRSSTGEQVYLLVQDGGSTSVSTFTGTAGQGEDKGIAFAFANDDFALSVTGGNQVTDSSGTVALGAAELQIGSASGASDKSASIYIKDIRYWPKRLTNAELEALVGN